MINSEVTDIIREAFGLYLAQFLDQQFKKQKVE